MEASRVCQADKLDKERETLMPRMLTDKKSMRNRRWSRARVKIPRAITSEKHPTRNMEMEPDIENMKISEYFEYEATTERRFWDDVRSRRSLTNFNEADVDSFHRNKIQDSIWEQDDDSKEDQEEDGDDVEIFDMWDITTEDVEQNRKFFNVLDEIEEIVQSVIPEPIHTTPPNDDYVAPATKSILDELLEEFGDEILNVAMIDEEANFNPT
ncbi:hypothetical protein Tco_1215901 [Tanacetum coccineum]